jgi:hypothetical protein
MSAAGLPLVIVGTVSVMIVTVSGEGQGSGGGVVGSAVGGWQGFLCIKVSNRGRMGRGRFVAPKSQITQLI